MRDEYDLSNSVRGKFYNADTKLQIPVYLDENVQAYFMQKADSKGVTLSDLVNAFSKRRLTSSRR
jgi:hypothetical protein